MRPPSPHSKFFSSLKQVEKRLKLESPTQSSNSSPASSSNIQINHTLTESLSTPIFFQTDQEPNTHSSTALQESSEPPLAFLSSSPQSPPIDQTVPREFPKEHLNSIDEAKSSGIDEIDLLMQLLGFSDFGRGKQNEGEDAEGIERVSDECCGCESGFYEKIVGVKGPKCKKEAERLDGWISYFLQSGGGVEERMETLRLGYLLLGKAACELEGGGDSHGFGGLDFPLAIEEFLKNDPPTQ
ncbi:uncharacterized protein [Euphorbia lathyris]|uniref:uncharacterized protein n=1 Tax=Euphorbia lathyris TaxID=212925 RepID=UPI00331426AB